MQQYRTAENTLIGSAFDFSGQILQFEVIHKLPLSLCTINKKKDDNQFNNITVYWCHQNVTISDVQYSYVLRKDFNFN